MGRVGLAAKKLETHKILSVLYEMKRENTKSRLTAIHTVNCVRATL